MEEKRDMMYRSSTSVPWCNLCMCWRDQKRQWKKPCSGKLATRPDHPRRRIEILFAWE